MIVPVDACVTADHLPILENALRSTGIPGKVELSAKHVEIVPPVYADPHAIEILRPVIEDVLKRVVAQIKAKS